MNIKKWPEKLILILSPLIYKHKYLNVDLKGGLCNKIHCLISACDLAIKNKSFIIEPYFGWKEKILFSDIYDLDYFNKSMSVFFNRKQIIIPRESLKDKAVKRKIIKNRVDLWQYSEMELVNERNSCKISKDSTKIKVLKWLKLKSEYEQIVTKYTKDFFTAIQVRTESDWVEYSKKKQVDENEEVLVTLPTLSKMLSDFPVNGRLFYTSGENHQDILKAFKEIGYNPYFFYDPKYEYEINAAINFEICSMAQIFIGLSRSSYSNLISLKRALILNDDNSYIYNYKGMIVRRVDKGLHPVAVDSITKETLIF